MRPLLFLTLFLAAGVTANEVVGMYQVLFFYQLYRAEVDAFGAENTRMVPGCGKEGATCDLQAFLKEICKFKNVPKLVNKKIVKDPITNKTILVDVPDFSDVKWEKFKDDVTIEEFRAQFENSGLKGDVFNEKLFKDWDKPDNFKNVMSEAEDIGKKAIAKLKQDGKGDNEHVKNMQKTLEVHANARRADQAKRINESFEKIHEAKKFAHRQVH